MCGIIAICRPSGLTAADIEKFKGMLARCETRGRDATGIYNAKGQFFKAPFAATKFLKQRTVKKILEESVGCAYVVGHCRYATRGSPFRNHNNHPVYDKNRKFFLVHNGMVECKKFDYHPKNTDTLILSQAIEYHAARMKGSKFSSVVRKAFNDITANGDNMSAIITGDGKELVFARTYSSPLEFQLNDGGNVLYAASTTEIIGLENNAKDSQGKDQKEYYDLQDHSMVFVDLRTGEMFKEVLETHPKPVAVVKKIGYDYTYPKCSFDYDDCLPASPSSIPSVKIDDLKKNGKISDRDFVDSCTDCRYCDENDSVAPEDGPDLVYCALKECFTPEDSALECNDFRW